MANVSVENLNQQYAIEDSLVFKQGPNGFIYAEITNDRASAQIFLHGAHLTSYVPNGEEPVIFLSPQSTFEPGKAIRGGIPISWPWFADHPTDKTKPAHGFARTSEWEVRGAQKISAIETHITLGLRDSENTRKLWDYSFDLEATISVGARLNVELAITNTDKKDFTVSDAFHAYYNVGDIKGVSISGLEGANYIDKVDSFTTKKQNGPISITNETDRIYLDTKNDCVIEDRALNRNILISKNGSNSTVVWNPWSEKARTMKDLGDEDYKRFICVETTNAGTDTVTIAPNEQHKLRMNVLVLKT